MKKTLLALALIVTSLTICSNYETHYTREGVIVSKTDTIYTIEDTTGNLWDVEADNLQVNDQVVLKMYTNGTDDCITDDIVLKVYTK